MAEVYLEIVKKCRCDVVNCDEVVVTYLYMIECSVCDHFLFLMFSILMHNGSHRRERDVVVGNSSLLKLL